MSSNATAPIYWIFAVHCFKRHANAAVLDESSFGRRKGPSRRGLGVGSLDGPTASCRIRPMNEKAPDRNEDHARPELFRYVRTVGVIFGWKD
jgi:hypothetical protein